MILSMVLLAIATSINLGCIIFILKTLASIEDEIRQLYVLRVKDFRKQHKEKTQ